MTDDAGFAIPSTFGGVIPTPTMDRIAEQGLRYNRIFSTSLCSPTRAAQITGRNHHSVGFGVIAEQATGFPGYDSVIGVDNATIGRILRDNGYATSLVRQGPQHADLPGQPGRALHPVADRHGLRLLLRLRRRRRQPVGAEPLPQHDPDLPLDRSRGHLEDGSIGSQGGDLAGHRQGELLEPDHRDGRRRHRLDVPDSPDRPRASRSLSITCPAPPTRRITRPRSGWTRSTPCISSTTATRSCASASSRTRRSSA